MKRIDNYLELGRVNAMLDAAEECSVSNYLLTLRVLWRSGIRVSKGNVTCPFRPSSLSVRRQPTR
jgi:hypothetical protein